MESMDEQIVKLLTRDGRMSYTDVGREAGLSTSAAQQRVRRLEQRGVITGYRAVVDPAALDKMLTAFVQLRALDPTTDDQIPEKIAPLPAVVSCYSVAGQASHILVVQVGTPLELEALLTQIRQVAQVSTETTLVLSVSFQDRPLV
jgi:Lrp/AsnC family transcriptional regulator, leucine-responsive regulatory protein